MNDGAKCWACFFYDQEREICSRDGSGYSGKHREKLDPACEGFRGSMLARRDNPKPGQMAVADPQIAGALAADVRQLGQYIGQLGQMIAAMQRRMDEMEKQQAAVTIRHEDVKRLQGLIRMRAEQICGKYELTDKDSPRIFRAAIKKDLLKRFGVKDLHDVPAAMLAGAESLVNSWTSVRLVMERRNGK